MKLTELLAQEETLTLRQFTNQDALHAGQYVIDRALREQLSVAVELKRNGQRLFYAALDGTAPDQEEWIRRKHASRPDRRLMPRSVKRKL